MTSNDPSSSDFQLPQVHPDDPGDRYFMLRRVTELHLRMEEVIDELPGSVDQSLRRRIALIVSAAGALLAVWAWETKETEYLPIYLGLALMLASKTALDAYLDHNITPLRVGSLERLLRTHQKYEPYVAALGILDLQQRHIALAYEAERCLLENRPREKRDSFKKVA